MNKTAFARIQNGELDHWAATSGEHGRALGLVGGVARHGVLTGMRGAKVGEWPCDLQALADRGVPPNHDLPYDTDRLRALVQEAAQLLVD